ncbi:MAG TPA: NUDIX domain-containing protein [Candidatus Dormibacteraeota bacterium]|jgi:predicted NUDIX family phosphoesterase|nr:NUDIX domain-containing protein [Candidatus Dormibacteraeota bacterium]
MAKREEVLVVLREVIFRSGVWHGLRTEGIDALGQVLRASSYFLPRDEVEDDPAYQQIIPYIVFRHQRRYFLTKRLHASSEKRLRQQYSLGVGGHINPGDGDSGDIIDSGLRREWEEEVEYQAEVKPTLLGLLNDDSSPVSRVHLGVVFLVDGDRPEIAIRETEKLSGELLTIDEMRLHYLEMESWSQIVFDHLAESSSQRPGL